MKRPVAFYMLLIMASHISQMHDGDILQSLQFSVFLPESGIRFCFHTASCCVEYPLGNRE